MPSLWQGPKFTQINIISQNASKTVFFSYQPEKTVYKLRTTKKELRKNNLFFQNKPNLPKSQMDINSFDTGKYAKLDTWLDGKNKPNQTQFKANSNPKQTQLSK